MSRNGPTSNQIRDSSNVPARKNIMHTPRMPSDFKLVAVVFQLAQGLHHELWIERLERRITFFEVIHVDLTTTGNCCTIPWKLVVLEEVGSPRSLSLGPHLSWDLV